MASPLESVLLVKQQLAAQLKSVIVEGELRPGQRVVEAAWAKRFGVAQASVREAINLLITEGFLVKSAGRSARVPQYTEKDLVQIYQVRGALEGLAARLACEARSDLSALEAMAGRMEEAAAQSDVAALVAADLGFHLALAEASGSPMLAETIGRLIRPLFTFVAVRVRETHESTLSWHKDLPLHRQMIALIRTGSPQVAGQFVDHCVGRFQASARDVWTPTAHSRSRKNG